MIAFSVSSAQILAFCALISAVYGVYKIYKEVKKPSDDLKNEVAKHSQYLTKDMQRISEIEDSNKVIIDALFSLVNHSITGNGIDKLKDTREKLQNHLLDK